MRAELYTLRLEQDRDDIDAYHFRGHIHHRLGKFAKADEDFSEAVQRKPENQHFVECRALPLNAMSWLIAAKPDCTLAEYGNALRHVKIASQLAPDDGGILNTLGVTQYRMGQFEQALATRRRSDEINSAKAGVPFRRTSPSWP